MEIMKKLEVLLNRLMGGGWEPRGRKKTLYIKIYDCDLNVYLDGGFMNEDKKSFRELVSKESGLWQFVCENRLIEPDHMKQYNLYEYRIMQSALKDESELEDFLLQNIKVEGK